MDVPSHIEHWKQGAEEDFAAARSLLDRGHLRHALFFAQLAPGKTLKAHVTRRTGDVPPRMHSLVRLAGLAGITLDPEREDALREFGIHQMAGRYPGSEQAPLDTNIARRELSRAEETLRWLTTLL